MVFDANRDIKIEGTQQLDGTFTLTSKGLLSRSRPELEIVGVPDEKIAGYAAIVINRIANYTVNEKPVAIGERIALTSDDCALIAKIVESPDGGKRGIGRFFGGGKPARVRIVEPIDGMQPLKTMISTIMVWKAHVAIEADRAAEALSLLRDAIDFFPGDPAQSDAPPFGVAFNWQNHLAYKSLAEIVEDPNEGLELAQQALARCNSYRDDQIGDIVAELGALTRDVLAARAHIILSTNARETPNIAVNKLLTAVTSPIWRRFEDGAGRRQNIVPKSLQYSGEPVRQNADLLDVAVDLVATNVTRPAMIARLVSSTVQHWEGGGAEAPVLPVTEPYRFGDMLLSAALAHVARLYAADMNAAEIRAHCGLGGSDDATQSAERKRADLEAAEGEAIMLAMTGG